MSEARYAKLAAALISRQVKEETRQPSELERARAVMGIERALKQRTRTQLVRRTALALAAAIVLVVPLAWQLLQSSGSSELTPMTTAVPAPFFIVHHPTDAAKAYVEGREVPLTEGMPLESGARVVTPASGAVELELSTGTRLRLAQQSDLRVTRAAAEQRLMLASGTVRAEVAKLQAGERFVLATGDVEVEVRGTVFEVSIASTDSECAQGSRTRVAVEEGTVAVRHQGTELLVRAGEHWPSCPPQAARPTSTLAQTSTLAAQNNLYGKAMSAKKGGRSARALGLFNQFLHRYPKAPLSEAAEVERMRLLVDTDPQKGRGAAREYLRRNPRGFARAEAQQLLGGPR